MFEQPRDLRVLVGGDEWASRVRRRLSRSIFRRLWCGRRTLRPVLPVAVYLLLQRINTYLMRWAGKKYKRLRGYRPLHAWWLGIVRHDPALFAHWRWVRTFAFAELR